MMTKLVIGIWPLGGIGKKGRYLFKEIKGLKESVGFRKKTGETYRLRGRMQWRGGGHRFKKDRK